MAEKELFGRVLNKKASDKGLKIDNLPEKTTLQKEIGEYYKD